MFFLILIHSLMRLFNTDAVMCTSLIISRIDFNWNGILRKSVNFSYSVCSNRLQTLNFANSNPVI